ACAHGAVDRAARAQSRRSLECPSIERRATMWNRTCRSLCVLGMAVSLASAGETLRRPMQRRVEPPLPRCVTNVTASERQEWTDEIASERWSTYAPLSAIRNKMKKPIRTAHYVVLTD